MTHVGDAEEEQTMQFGVFVFGAVPMPDAGPGAPAPTDRRVSNDVVWRSTEDVVGLGVDADRLGYEYFFFTEHHFQHEGYEVIPNPLMCGTVLAERTERIKIGALVSVLPQWHPLRYAEDFATLHNFSGGRAVLSVGRGTVPREAMPLGAVVGSTDDPEQRAAQDALNREMFDEAVDLVLAALDQERFSYRGKHWVAPPDGIPDRGGTVTELTLVPRPIHPYECWQTITSPSTLDAVAQRGFGGVWWNVHPDYIAEQWTRFEEVYRSEHGRSADLSSKRMLVLNVRIDDTYEAAMTAARPGHDEFWKFLGPYGRARGHKVDGQPAPQGWIPRLEDSVAQRIYAVGTPDDVAEVVTSRIAELGAERVALFPLCLGDPYEQYTDQITRFAEEVRPTVERELGREVTR